MDLRTAFFGITTSWRFSYGLVFSLLTGQLLWFLTRSVPQYYCKQLSPISLSLAVMIVGLLVRSLSLVLFPLRNTDQLLDRNVDAYFILAAKSFPSYSPAKSSRLKALPMYLQYPGHL